MNFEHIGMRPAEILLPKAGSDMNKWAVVACDQFTSQPEYWGAGGLCSDNQAARFFIVCRLVFP